MRKRAFKKSLTICFLGISGSGKGTQMKLLLRYLPGAVNVSTGDAFRKISRRKNLLSRYVAGILAKGDLVPYWGPVWVWLSAFFENMRGDEPLVLDGAPRRVEEAKVMDDFMRDFGRPLPLAVYLRVSRGEAMRRLLKRARADDNPRAIRGRFEFFLKFVRPVARYYERRGRLIVIDGDQSIPDVWRDVRRSLAKKLGKW